MTCCVLGVALSNPHIFKYMLRFNTLPFLAAGTFLSTNCDKSVAKEKLWRFGAPPCRSS
ncbi:hypothetical protein MNBD_DELTA02-518 [hydrothermal vent metagenome]|uniref:Uncharacterized protein n=1 Tax=hydrothermal vent metagenome TaxID=652676 RepID=A0A3B0V215_9ZZZZ